MRSIAKASSAGSNQRQAAGLGRILRGALATRGASIPADGSGAPAAAQALVPARAVPAMLAALLAAALLLALAAAPAQGAVSKRVPEEIFGSAAEPEFVQPQNLAVDYDTGELYALDVGSGRKNITRWNPDGTPSPFPALGTNAIDGKKGPEGKECAEEPASCDWNGDGANAGFTLDTGVTSRKEYQIAIDESGGPTDGNIYLSQKTRNLVEVFAADGTHLGQLTGYEEGPKAEGAETAFALGGPTGVAVDEGGAIYVPEGDLNGVPGLIHKYAPVGALPLNADNTANFESEPQPRALAAGAGPSAGFVFYNTGNASDTFKIDSATGAQIGDPIVLNNQSTVSVSPQSGHVFVSDGPTNAIAFNRVKEIDASGAEPVEVALVEGTSLRGYAQSKDGNRLFVARNVSKLEVYGAPLPVPVVVTDPATDVDKDSGTLNGSVDPEGLEVEDCHFEYVSEETRVANEEAEADPFEGATDVECVETVGSGTDPVAVHADVTALKEGERFHYRLSATTLAATIEAEEQSFATTIPPTILSEAASAITDSEATIQVSVDPQFYATAVWVEYGIGGAFDLETPKADAGEGGTPQQLTFALEGLAPDTTYEWRVVASNQNGESVSEAAHSFTTYRPFAPETGCANQELRSGLAANLPDCRAYEMVSPIDKNGVGIVVPVNLNSEEDAYMQARPDGGRLAYSAAPSFGDQLGSQYYNQYISARGGGGWTTEGVDAPLAEGRLAIPTERWVSGFTEDLCSMFFWDYNEVPLNADAQEGFTNLYRRQNCAPGVGGFETLTTAAPPEDASKAYVRPASVQGASADGGTAFFLADAPLTAEAAEGTDFDKGQVYAHLAGDPALRLVSVLPSGKASPPGNMVGAGNRGNLKNAVSEDGTRVYWTRGSFGSGQLYLRSNPAEPQSALAGEECTEAEKACTVAVSAGSGATFWDARPDGSAALYSEGNLGSGAGTLHRFEAGAAGPPAELAGKLYGVLGASEDLSRIYLVSGEDYDGGGPAEEGGRNLYLREDGAGFEFVGELLAEDFVGQVSVASATPRGRAARVTPDGGAAVFQSRAPLSGFDNASAEAGEAAMEVFRYEAGGGIICVSCNPAGIAPRTRELLSPFRLSGSGVRAAAWIPTWEQSLHASRVISDDGDRIFFHSFDPLVPRDANGTVQDLYQWEAPGTGSCDTADPLYFPQNGGCISLISSGTSASRSLFVDASADGSDVFFRTESSLLPQDPGLSDIYDARVGGGFPTPAEEESCEGEACQSPPGAPEPVVGATATHKGPGNLAPGRNCRRAARGASKLSRQAKRLRRRAARAGNRAAAKRLRRAGRKRARQAKRKSRAAKRCRRANRRARR